MKKSECFLIILLISLEAKSQIINNPSFEGIPKQNIPPPGWLPCDSSSTPDTEPGFWNVYNTPSDGVSYITMVTRGPLGPNSNTFEDCQTQLVGALHIGTCYFYSIDLARSDTWGHDSWNYGWVSYTQPVFFRIWCGSSSCTRDELLWQTGPVTHIEWETYNFALRPTISDCNYLIMDVYYSSMPTYFGNILIDNMKYLGRDDVTIVKMDSIVQRGQEVLLSASPGGASYIWNPTTNLSCWNCTNPIATINQDMTYEVLISDSNGCAYHETFILSNDIVIPNIVTPNGDGQNDEFRIKGLPSNSSLTILNRWGKIIYKTPNYDNRWDGRGYTDGVYYYLLNSPKLEKTWTGFVSIMK